MCIPIKDEASDSKTVRHPYVHAVNLATGWNPVLAAMGAQGWELVTVLGEQAGNTIVAACFKRPR